MNTAVNIKNTMLAGLVKNIVQKWAKVFVKCLPFVNISSAIHYESPGIVVFTLCCLVITVSFTFFARLLCQGTCFYSPPLQSRFQWYGWDKGDLLICCHHFSVNLRISFSTFSGHWLFVTFSLSRLLAKPRNSWEALWKTSASSLRYSLTLAYHSGNLW